MRSMQFAGEAINLNPARMFNCSYLPVSEIDAFWETMFLLLCGCGVGFSVGCGVGSGSASGKSKSQY